MAGKKISGINSWEELVIPDKNRKHNGHSKESVQLNNQGGPSSLDHKGEKGETG